MSRGSELVQPVDGMEPSLAMLGAVTRLRPLPGTGWLMEDRELGSSLCKAHLRLPEVRGRTSREGWRVRRLEGHQKLDQKKLK